MSGITQVGRGWRGHRLSIAGAPLGHSAETPTELGGGSPDRIPSILLACLALDSRFQGRPERYVSTLLVEALALAVEVSRRGRGRLIVVDAIDANAAAFYEHHGFIASPDRNRLMMKVSDAAVSIDLPWP